MRVLICGSRTFKDEGLMYATLNTSPYIDTVIHGAAAGADTLAHDWAMTYARHVDIYRADWIREGRAAGILRNERMLKFGRPDRVVAFWDGKSKGTQHMIEIAQKAGIPVQVVRFDTEDSI